jgi:PEP-CTERM motif
MKMSFSSICAGLLLLGLGGAVYADGMDPSLYFNANGGSNNGVGFAFNGTETLGVQADPSNGGAMAYAWAFPAMAGGTSLSGHIITGEVDIYTANGSQEVAVLRFTNSLGNLSGSATAAAAGLGATEMFLYLPAYGTNGSIYGASYGLPPAPPGGSLVATYDDAGMTSANAYNVSDSNTGNQALLSQSTGFGLAFWYSVDSSAAAPGLGPIAGTLGLPYNYVSTPVTPAAGPAVPVSTPEPSTLTLLGLGVVGLVGYGLRRRKLAVA